MQFNQTAVKLVEDTTTSTRPTTIPTTVTRNVGCFPTPPTEPRRADFYITPTSLVFAIAESVSPSGIRESLVGYFQSNTGVLNSTVPTVITRYLLFTHSPTSDFLNLYLYSSNSY